MRRRRYHGRHEQGHVPYLLREPERAALRLLAASHHILPGSGWMVGRAVAHQLLQEGLVVATADLVLLTEAGGRALAEHQTRPDGQSRS